MTNPNIKKAVEYAITHLKKEVENLEFSLDTNHYIPLQRNILTKKLGNLKNDLEEFQSISL
ncbi:hypothetical protein [Viridibacillus arvi]|uniref:hypothetical protein n=1 Tax=Viridibacillus arvi TaxID=263475 RepID=UPI0034CD8DED